MLGWICKIFLGFILLGGVLFIIFHETLLRSYAKALYVNDATKGADAIVILGGNSQTRPLKAIDLHKKGYADLLLRTELTIQDNPYPGILISEMETIEKILEKEGVKGTLVKNPNGGCTSTFDEAYDIARYGTEHDFRRIIIVTDPFHTARARYAFQKVFDLKGVDIQIEVAATHPLEGEKLYWWKHEQGIVDYFLESIKWLYYLTRSSNSDLFKQR